MTFHLDAFNQSIQHDPMYKDIAKQRSRGTPINHVVIDTETGDVLVSENGAPYVPAHPYIKAMVTGTPYRDPGDLNPIASDAVRLHPDRKAAHDAEVVSMMQYLIEEYRADLLTHPALDRILNEMVAANDRPSNRKALAALGTNYDRWDLLLEKVIDRLDGK
jgi:hypothetical protein